MEAALLGIKVRVLQSKVVGAASATGLTDALRTFYDGLRDSEAELVSMIRVADYQVLITYTGRNE
jgi:hypothetical protein